MEERIMTKHPAGKQGVNILKSRYDTVKDAILHVLGEKGPLTFSELSQAVTRKLKGRFDGKIPWYVVTVKLDLQARGQIVHQGRAPQKWHLKG